MNTEIAAVLSKDINKLELQIEELQKVLGMFLQAQQVANQVTESRLQQLEDSANVEVDSNAGSGQTGMAPVRTNEDGKEL